MTVSVNWVGNGRQFTANTSTETSVIVAYAGSGGTPSVNAADGAFQGSNAMTCQVNKRGIAMLVALPSALDFTPSTGSEDGQLVYVWGAFLAPALLLSRASNGFGIAMSSGTPTTSNYSLWSFYGNATYFGGWKRMIIDPTKTRSGGAGTFSVNNVTHIGVFANVGGATARFDNLLLDACDVGTGLQIDGTSTLGLVEELLADEVTNRYGIVTSLNDSDTAAQLAGKLILGDTGGTAANITDENSTMFVAEPLYYQTSLKASVPLTYAGVEVVGSGSGATDVKFGQAVGTDRGRSGCAIIGNSTYTVGFDRDDGAVESADLYGCIWRDLTGTLNLDGNHDFNSNRISGCAGVSVADGSTVKNMVSVASGQINLNSSGVLTSAVVINNTASASVLTTSLEDVTGCSFTSDGSNHAIELSSIGDGTMDWDNTTSGYEAGSVGSPVTPTSTGNEDIYVNVGSGELTISVVSGATTPSIRSAGATVNVQSGSVTVKVTSAKEDGSAVGEAYVHLRAKDGTGPFPYQESVSITRSTTTATVDHTSHGMATNDKVLISGITDKVEDNGVHQINVSDADTYTYVTDDSGSTSYNGSITSTFVALDGETNITTGVLSTSRVYSSDQPVIGWARKSTASPFYKQGGINKDISSTTGLDYTAVLVLDE